MSAGVKCMFLCSLYGDSNTWHPPSAGFLGCCDTQLFLCETQTSCFVLCSAVWVCCSRLHSWTELVFAQTHWDLAWIPFWLCFLEEYSKDGISPTSDSKFSSCHHYLSTTKIPQPVISLFLCCLTERTWPVGTGLSQPGRQYAVVSEHTRLQMVEFLKHVSPGHKWMSPSTMGGFLKVRGLQEEGHWQDEHIDFIWVLNLLSFTQKSYSVWRSDAQMVLLLIKPKTRHQAVSLSPAEVWDGLILSF